MLNPHQQVGETLVVQHKRNHKETEQVEVVQEPVVVEGDNLELLVVRVELE